MAASERLNRILSMIRPGTLLADIGTDHAYVPIEAVRRGLCRRALACDVVPGPLLRARENIEAAGLSDRIETRLGDGLAALNGDHPDRIVIAGMGGPLMEDILAAGLESLASGTQLVLSPQSDWLSFRTFLATHGFAIRLEAMLMEAGKTYLIMDAVYTGEAHDDLPDRSLLRYGDAACYLAEDLPVRQSYINKDRDTAGAILRQLADNDSEAAVTRRQELTELIADAEEALR